MSQRSRASLVCLLITLLLPGPLRGQQPSAPPASPTTTSAEQDDVVRITTNLVQVDAVVTDKEGRLVSDLDAADFEILEDGRRQQITNFSFVRTVPEGTPPAPRPVADKKALPVPPVALRPEQVRRTIALVVDDLGLSFESIYAVRQALKKFVERNLQPTDLVAIVRTSAGMGALQQFTSDRQQLSAAIERVRWSPRGRGGISAFSDLGGDPLQRARLGGAEEQSRFSGRRDETRDAGDTLEEFREELFSVGTLGAIEFVVRGLREMPGRKSVLLFSDGIPIFNSEGERSARMLEAFKRLIDRANRASVVLYTMDARGLPTLALTAADNTSGLSAPQVTEALQQRRSGYFESQNGLNYLAQQTGGLFIHDNNDLAGGIGRVLDDQRGYYLIGYRPDAATFDARTGRRRYHTISVKVRRPGLRVRSRTGFYGVTDEEVRPVRRTREQQLLAALTSPFAGGQVGVRLTSLFANDERAGSFMRSMLFIDAGQLTFTEEPDGWRKAVLDVVAVTFGENGQVIDQFDRQQTIRTRGRTYQTVLKDGLIYTLGVPVKKAGAYQLRMAVRDAPSERTGSASQFIEVPDVQKNRLALSGLILQGTSPAAAAAAPAATPAPSSTPPPAAGQQAPETITDADPQASPAVRRFRHGMLMDYGFVIYNPQLDKTTGRPQLQAQVRLFRDGQIVFAGKEGPVGVTGQFDPKRIPAGGRLRLGPELEPGQYAIQVIITDLLAKEKYRTRTQWMDFEITK